MVCWKTTCWCRRYRAWRGPAGVRKALRRLLAFGNATGPDLSVPVLQLDDDLCFIAGCGFDSFILDDYERLRTAAASVPLVRSVVASVFGYRHRPSHAAPVRPRQSAHARARVRPGRRRLRRSSTRRRRAACQRNRAALRRPGHDRRASLFHFWPECHAVHEASSYVGRRRDAVLRRRHAAVSVRAVHTE